MEILDNLGYSSSAWSGAVFKNYKSSLELNRRSMSIVDLWGARQTDNALRAAGYSKAMRFVTRRDMVHRLTAQYDLQRPDKPYIMDINTKRVY